MLAYQRTVTAFMGGVLLELFDLIYVGTFGVLSVYMTAFISRAYMEQSADTEASLGGAAAASLTSFFILAGAYLPSFGIDSMGPKSMFLAILTGIGASALYLALCRFFRRRRFTLFSPGADRKYNRMLAALFPVALVVLAFAVFNLVIMRAFHVNSFRMLLANFFSWIFSFGETGFLKGFFFVLLSSLLWFFGIHGSDTLEGVMEQYFTPGLEENILALSAGRPPEIVLTKEFFDCFVLMGGCGATICLLIAILLFSRNRARRSLGLAAAFPMVFNINELMVFGLPVIFNPVMLIPFLAVPLVCYTTSYCAVSLGLVPMITAHVDWTTPILLGGYHATGSAAGSILQALNVVLGVLIYAPFIRLLDRQTEEAAKEQYASFLDFFQANEQELAKVRLIDRTDVYGDFAKGLCADLRKLMDRELNLAYQPQYHYDGRCVGAEALLRWRHPVHGVVYPPLVVKLAEDGGFLAALEEAVMLRALRDRPEVLRRFGPEVQISFNVTGTTVVTPRFLQFCRQENAREPLRGKNLCIEVTEQAAIAFNDETRSALRALRDMGFLLAIDDFSMGQTSLNYLKDGIFDEIKLDGSLVRGLFTHRNCQEIVASITKLATSLDMAVVAEFVETTEQREVLHGMGCDCYQGWLYSPAVFLQEEA